MREVGHSKLPYLWLAAFLVAAILLVPVVGFQDPGLTSSQAFTQPSFSHLLGTDQFGRDNLSRTVWALRDGIFATLLATALAGCAGLVLGTLTLFDPWLDRVVSLTINVLLSIPGVLLALVLLTYFEPSLVNVAVAVGISLSPVFARIARGALLSASTLDFVEASRALGAGNLRVVWFHLIPNVARELLSFLAVIFSWSALNIVALDFLGLAGSPSTATLGNLLVDGRTYLRVTPWIALGPGIALTLVTFIAFWLSDGSEAR